MKQLKFMLAAATAIGLATAAQAGADAQLAASTGFEEYTADEVVTTGTRETSATASTPSYFYYDGDTPADNESMVVGATAPSGMDRRPHGTGYFTGNQIGTEQVLKVNTGTDPLLRTIAPVVSEPVAQSLTVATYVDTLVQFTVTPAGDTVDNTADDKLMVYLKETAEDGVVTGTNLVVKAGYLSAESPAVAVAKEYVVDTGSVNIVPGTWYRLTVKAIPNLATADSQMYYPAFELSINDVDCTFDSAFCDTENDDALGIVLAACGETGMALLNSKTVVLSLCATGTAPATLKAVGFAGEGYVDDLIITTEDPDTPASTGVDFTLALGEGVSAVTWTIAEGGETITTTKAYTEVEPGEYKITSVTYADWYVADGDYVAGSKVTVADGQTVTVSAKEATSADLNVTVPEGTADTTVDAALAWAKAAGKSTTDVKGASNLVANYLLNVTDLTVEPQIEIVSIDASTTPVTITAKVTDAKGGTYEKVLTAEGDDKINASIKYRASATLETLKAAELKTAIEATDKFIQVVVE